LAAWTTRNAKKESAELSLRAPVPPHSAFFDRHFCRSGVGPRWCRFLSGWVDEFSTGPRLPAVGRGRLAHCPAASPGDFREPFRSMSENRAIPATFHLAGFVNLCPSRTNSSRPLVDRGRRQQNAEGPVFFRRDAGSIFGRDCLGPILKSAQPAPNPWRFACTTARPDQYWRIPPSRSGVCGSHRGNRESVTIDEKPCSKGNVPRFPCSAGRARSPFFGPNISGFNQFFSISPPAPVIPTRSIGARNHVMRMSSPQWACAWAALMEQPWRKWKRGLFARELEAEPWP